MKRSVFVFFIFLFFISCRQKNEIEFFSILTPKTEWKYYDDQNILFSTDLNSEELYWTSSLDLYLGKGSVINARLRQGNHEIVLCDKKSGIEVRKNIKVFHREESALFKCQLLNINKFLFESTKESFALFSTNGFTNSLNFSVEKNDIAEDNQILKDINVSNRDFNARFLTVKEKSYRSSVSADENKTFYVINTVLQNEAHKVDCQKIYENDILIVYIQKGTLEENNVLEKNIENCIEKITKIIFPRVNVLWGKMTDLDFNGKVTLVFSKTINDEGMAVGFFNQSDFFENIQDIDDKAYNPWSNEMDVIYSAFPDGSNLNYTVECICATVAHELTHGINFSKKTFEKIFNGNQADTMEIFLDEGLSHLSESLCGFGQSGGNVDFVNCYLKETGNYSFCKGDLYGQEDSVGRRGAMCLFLYYLFDKAGGMNWDEEGNIVDTGGVLFLRKIINSEDYGWNSIGQYFNKHTDLLFKDFCFEVLNFPLKEVFDFTIIDPLTGENLFACDEISLITDFDNSQILEYSFFKVEAVKSKSYQILTDDIEGNIYLLY